jgi:peptidyl-prolyl cis-trans isomerase B (cyclophilin B)
MKISLRNLIVFALVVVVLGLYLTLARGHSLPDGKMLSTTAIGIPEETPAVSPLIPGRPRVGINTSKGYFVVELRPDLAPDSVVNFLGKWSNGYCNFKKFHRVEDWVIQGCDPAGNGTGGKQSLKTEPSGLEFKRGSIGVARSAYPEDKSNDSQFFILKKDATQLDGGYTYLGKVVSGMEVVDAIAKGDTIKSTVILTK